MKISGIYTAAIWLLVGVIIGLYITRKLYPYYQEVPVVANDTVFCVKDAEQVIEIQETIKYKTDTVYVKDTIEVADSSQYHTYLYEKNNDSVSYRIALYSKEEPLWYWMQCEHKNRLSLIQTPDTTYIQSSNSIITGVSVKRKKDWKSRFRPTVGVGVGYGLTNRKIDVYVGGGISYTF